MAQLTADQLVQLRQRFAEGAATVGWTKAQVNAALQAVEDWFESARTAAGPAIEVVAPGVFTAGQKRRILKFWLQHKFERE